MASLSPSEKLYSKHKYKYKYIYSMYKNTRSTEREKSLFNPEKIRSSNLLGASCCLHYNAPRFLFSFFEWKKKEENVSGSYVYRSETTFTHISSDERRRRLFFLSSRPKRFTPPCLYGRVEWNYLGFLLLLFEFSFSSRRRIHFQPCDTSINASCMGRLRI